MHTRHRDNRNTACKALSDSQGFTLLEMAIVIAIIGSLIMTAIGFALPLMRMSDRLETAQKMALISREINRYAMEHYRLPCPDNSWNSVQGLCTSTQGLVPVEILNLSEDFLTDAYGGNFQYVISPSFAQDTTDASLLVHPRCRTRDWYYRDPVDVNNVIHKNPQKARFCCPSEYDPSGASMADKDIVIIDESGNTYPDLRRNADESSSDHAPTDSECDKLDDENIGHFNSHYDVVDDPYRFKACLDYEKTERPFSLSPNTMVPPTDPITAVAYALTSYGPDGDNDALKVGTTPGAFGTHPEVHVRVDPEVDATYDDLVIWRTQHNIMEDNNESCVFP